MISIAEVRYFFQASLNNSVQTLALVSMYAQPDMALYSASHSTIWACRYMEEDGLCIVKAQNPKSYIIYPTLVYIRWDVEGGKQPAHYELSLSLIRISQTRSSRNPLNQNNNELSL